MTSQNHIKTLFGKDNTSFLDLQKNEPDNKVLGGLIGLLCGDALGVPYEFNLPEDIPEKAFIDMQPPISFLRSHSQVPIGTWSDDGSQALCVLASITNDNQFEIDTFTSKLCDWYTQGYLAIDNNVFDVGIQTSTAIDRLLKGVDFNHSGNNDEFSNGNGSLMRVLPLALYLKVDDGTLVKYAHLQSLPTHAHPRAMVACAYYCLVARAYLSHQNNLNSPWEVATSQLTNIYKNWSIESEASLFLNELSHILDSSFRKLPTGSGYVVDTLWSAKRALEENSYEDVVKTAIAMGRDTDTTACVAGGLAGIKFGLAGIPNRWLEELKGFNLLATHF